VIDLLSMQEITWNQETLGTEYSCRPIDESRMHLAAEWRQKMIDSISHFSDEVTELYLDGKEIPLDLLKKVIRELTIARHFTPVLVGSSLKNIGVQPLLSGVVDFLPSPVEVPPIKGILVKTEETVDVPVDPSAPALALVFKIQADREAGYLSFIRVYSGIIKKNSAVLNIDKKKKERITRLLRMHANRYEQLDSVGAGDIAVAIGFKFSQTGDTIGNENHQVILERMHFPEPVISVAIEPQTLAERDKLKATLDLLKMEDPTFLVKDDEETGQLVISGMGELHLDVLVTRIIDDFKIVAHVGKPQVTYRESITKTVVHTEKYHRVLAGKENTAEITLRVAPLERGSGNRFSSEVTKDDLPRELIDAVERGVTGGFSSGVMYGYPLYDVEAVLVSAVYDQLHSTAIAFEAAGSLGLDAACRKASPILLEPVMHVDVMTPKDFVGEVMSHLTSRNCTISSLERRSAVDHIRALAPLAEMFGYSTALRSMTQGRGTFAMEFSHFRKKEGGL
ncbi:MAG: elongation factor G, partial [Spirochaetales bacterium]|nr:elongation factor G [Spirochaetales bacterium]